MKEEELKKGCGKEFYLKQTSKKKSLCNGFGLCPTCQARLEGFQKGKLGALNKIEKVFSQYRGEVAKMIKEELIKEIGGMK